MGEHAIVPRYELSELVSFIFRRFGSVADVTELPDHIVPCVRALEAALSAAGSAPACHDCGSTSILFECVACSATNYPTAALSAAPPADSWRCFHCDETFTTREAAAEHFGTREWHSPGCQIDLAEYRRMEAKEASYADEDAAIHRQMHGQRTEHQQALRRAEEAGYAKGLRDAVLHPADAAPPAEPVGCGELATLYDAASVGFHVSETCGPDGKYQRVSKFRSMDELHAFEDAWTKAMLAVRGRKA